MKILYISSTSAGMHDHGIYYDLLKEFSNQGHNVTIVYAREKRQNKDTELYTYSRMTYLGIKTMNTTKNKNFVEKTASILSIDRLFANAIKKHLEFESYDLVLYSTPPITFKETLKYFKNKGSILYLMLKDIFPQNGADIGLFRENGIIYKFFKRKEKFLYSISDHIGVMSQANKEYFIIHNPEFKEKVSILPNALNISENPLKSKRSDFDLNETDLILIYGGNLGKPQGVDFIVECIRKLETLKNVTLLICGEGSESSKISDVIRDESIKNTTYLGSLETERYNNLAKLVDVGLIFLDNRFTIPNYPQRVLSYMEAEIPIISATDVVTDIGTDAVRNKYGFSITNESTTEWLDAVTFLKNNPEQRVEMGKSGRRYLLENFNVQKNCEKIIEVYEKIKGGIK